MQKGFLLFLLAVGFIFSAAVGAEELPQLIKMKNEKGLVLFHHAEHQASVNTCTDCHHMGMEKPACRDCHGVDRMIPRIKHAFHRQCRNCHIKSGGPTECDTCHDIGK